MSQKTIHYRLRQIGSVQVGTLLSDGTFAHHVFLPINIAKPQSGADDLGEAATIGYIAIVIKTLDGGKLLSCVPQIAVGVVLHDKKMILCRQFRNLLTAFQRKRPPGGILEAGNHIEKLRVMPFCGFFKRVDPYTMIVAGDGNQIGFI